MSRITSPFTSAATIIVIGLALQQSARAQANYGTLSRPPAAPNQQRLSPYLNLFRADNSLLGPYHSFVQPRQELQQKLSRQQFQIGQLQQASGGQGASPYSGSAARQQTGRGATFNNYLHYYRVNPALHSK